MNVTIHVVFVLLLVAAGLAIVDLAPVNPTIKRIVQIIVIVAAILWSFGQYHVGPGLGR